jgi:hypothetical protein
MVSGFLNFYPRGFGVDFYFVFSFNISKVLNFRNVKPKMVLKKGVTPYGVSISCPFAKPRVAPWAINIQPRWGSPNFYPRGFGVTFRFISNFSKVLNFGKVKRTNFLKRISRLNSRWLVNQLHLF